MKEEVQKIIEVLESLEQTIEVRGALISAEKFINALSVIPEKESLKEEVNAQILGEVKDFESGTQEQVKEIEEVVKPKTKK